MAHTDGSARSELQELQLKSQQVTDEVRYTLILLFTVLIRYRMHPNA